MILKNPPIEIDEHITMLGIKEFPSYLVTGGEESAIFEGGVGALGAILEEQIQERDISTDSVTHIVVTHGHPDHVMAVPTMRRLFPNAIVCASQTTAATLSSEKAVSFFSKTDQAFCGSLLKSGSVKESHAPQPLEEPTIPIDRVLKEGETLAVGALSFDILETPGHSDCSLSFHEPNAKLLIVSDATGYYFSDDNTWWPNYLSDYAAYLESMRRLAKLEANVLCLSHNATIVGEEAIQAYFAGAVAATESYHERIVSAVREGKPAQDIAIELAAEVFEKTQLLPLLFFQKSCGLLVKLSMRQEGLSEQS